MSGGERKGAGRKAVPIDLLDLEKLCAIQCSDEEIAGFFKVSVRTIQNRRAQMRLVEAGNVPMIIFLGKNRLGQKDNIAGVRLSLPPMETAQDVARAAEEATQAMGRGEISPPQLESVMRVLDVRARIIAEVQMVRRVEKLEENWA